MPNRLESITIENLPRNQTVKIYESGDYTALEIYVTDNWFKIGKNIKNNEYIKLKRTNPNYLISKCAS